MKEKKVYCGLSGAVKWPCSTACFSEDMMPQLGQTSGDQDLINQLGLDKVRNKHLHIHQSFRRRDGHHQSLHCRIGLFQRPLPKAETSVVTTLQTSSRALESPLRAALKSH